MAMVSTGTQTTNEDIKPTRDELLDYMYAINDLIAYRAVKINGYKVDKFENVISDNDYECMTECANIVDEFRKNYPNIPL